MATPRRCVGTGATQRSKRSAGAAGSHDPEGETLDVFEFLARVLTQIPEPRRHNVHYFGAYSSKARARQNRVGLKLNPPQGDDSGQPDVEPKSSSKYRAALRKRWANLIRRVYKTDPLICPACGGRLRIIAFISEPKTIGKIIDHLDRNSCPRAPPQPNSDSFSH